MQLNAEFENNVSDFLIANFAKAGFHLWQK